MSPVAASGLEPPIAVVVAFPLLGLKPLDLSARTMDAVDALIGCPVCFPLTAARAASIVGPP